MHANAMARLGCLLTFSLGNLQIILIIASILQCKWSQCRLNVHSMEVIGRFSFAVRFRWSVAEPKNRIEGINMVSHVTSAN